MGSTDLVPSDCLDLICTGETVLFVGAGATRAASGPTGAELAIILASEFSRSDIDTSNLTRFADILTGIPAVDRHEVDRHIIRLLKDLQPTAAHRMVASFAWRGIFTTNYDRLIEVAYDTATEGGRRVQDLLSTHGTSDLATALDPQTVPFFKLHGCISSISAKYPLVLTTRDFARTKKSRGKMLKFLRGLARNHSILFLGYSFSDGVALDLLEQVEAESPYGRTRRMYAVDPAATGSAGEYLLSRNITPIPLSMEAFFAHIDAHLTTEARRRCLTQRIADFNTADGRRFDVPPRLLAALDRQLVQLGPTASGPADAKRFYSGQPPLAGDLRNQHDIERDRELALTDLVRSSMQGSDYLRPIVAVLGSGGAGKSTFASRVAHNLAQSNEAAAFQLKAEELWNREDIVDLARLSPVPVVLVVDGLEVRARYNAIKELRHDLSRARVPALLLVSCQKAVWNTYESSHPSVGVRTFDLDDRLSEGEAQALVGRLSALDIIATRSSSERAVVAREIFESYEGHLVVALLELIRGGIFRDIVLAEYENLTARAKTAYQYVALLHQHGLAVPDYLLNQVTVKDWALFTTEVIALDAELIIIHDVSSTARRLFFRTRHPIIARVIVEATVRKQEDRVRMYRAVVAALGTSREDRDFLLRLLTSRQVREDIGEASDIKAIFEAALDLFPDDRRLLLHLGKFETQYGNYDRAREILEWGRSIEPRDSYIIHQLGVCYEERGKRMAPGAVRDGTLQEALRYFRLKQEIDPLSHYGYSSEARLHLRQARELGHAAVTEGDLEPLSAATDAIRRGLSLVRPDDTGPLNERQAELLGLLGRPEDVVATIEQEKARRGTLTYASTYHLLAASLIQAAKHDAAISAIQDGLQHFPRDQRLLSLLLDELESRLYISHFQELIGKVGDEASRHPALAPKALFAQAVVSYYQTRFADTKRMFGSLREGLGHRAPTKIRQLFVDASGQVVSKVGVCTTPSGRPTIRELDSGLMIGVDAVGWIKSGRRTGEVRYELGFSLVGLRAAQILPLEENQ
jgi:tetratricopeptide (TPR) repeat protein